MYDATLKTYEAATPNIVHYDLTGGFVSFKFVLAMRHICCGATLSLTANDADDFMLAEGEIVRAFFNSGDTTPIWTGTITRRERDVRTNIHHYELAGLWAALNGVLVTADQAWVNTPVETIVSDLFTTYIGGAIGVITAPGVIDNFNVKIGDEISKTIDTLAALAPTAGEGWTWGIDGAGDFIFRAVSTDPADFQIDAQVTIDVIAARETHSREPHEVLTVVGDFSGDVGSRVKKTFTSGSGAGRRLIAQVPGITTEAGMSRYATNWLARYANPNAQVVGLRHVRLDDNSAPPFPQNGQARYRDANAGYDLTDYISSMEVSFGEWYEYSIRLGLAGNGDDPAEAVEQNSPAALDSYIGSSDYAALDALPEASDISPLPAGYPRGWTESAIDSKVAAGGSGASGITRGYLVNIWASSPVTGVPMQVYAEIENGGTAFNAGEVTFYAQQVESDGTAHGTLTQTGAKISTHGSVELWGTASGFGPFTGEGMVRFAVSEIDTTVTPNVAIYPIADIIGTPADWAKCPAKRLINDSSSSVITAQTIIAGWLGVTA